MNIIYQKHSKYGYNVQEMILMSIITGITNFATIPALVIVKKQQMLNQFFIGVFTLTTSFMYHILESLDCKYFIIEEGRWHRLDNIGAIVCFQMLITQLSDLRDWHLENLLNYLGLFIALICQACDPWNLNYTIGPIIFQVLICLIFVIKNQRIPQVNHQKLKKGLIVSVFAIIFFSLSQNEYEDYLRFYHGLWHTCVGWFSFYVWQLRCEQDFTFSNFYKLQLNKRSEDFFDKFD